MVNKLDFIVNTKKFCNQQGCYEKAHVAGMCLTHHKELLETYNKRRK